MASTTCNMALQVNYADLDAHFLGKPSDFYHRYQIFGSEEGASWFIVKMSTISKLRPLMNQG